MTVPTPNVVSGFVGFLTATVLLVFAARPVARAVGEPGSPEEFAGVLVLVGLGALFVALLVETVVFVTLRWAERREQREVRRAEDL